ncbi:MAG: hypothetical protein MUD17_12130 [Gemmatimonadaceae bacterium]|nr:hypothetical protein [Gemmatimonadaceae bacterium]
MPETATPVTAPLVVLTTDAWQERERAHRARVEPFTRAFRERRARGASHPVLDFLFTYYHFSTGRLETWHPATGEALEDSAAAQARFRAPVYQAHEGVRSRDLRAMTDAQRSRLHETRALLYRTQSRAAQFGCFGMHEWAMVYGGHDVRHEAVAPLRLEQAEIDAFVESRPIVCSHFDAFRFFAPAARPLNRLPLAWETRDDLEQPGCIHANMDLYRWAYTSMPWVGSDVLVECFELALALRELDMQAGPYDLRAFEVMPVCIETPEGREEYQRRQRALSERAAVLRARLIASLDDVLRHARVMSA